jgi:hypothetical protein
VKKFTLPLKPLGIPANAQSVRCIRQGRQYAAFAWWQMRGQSTKYYEWACCAYYWDAKSQKWIQDKIIPIFDQTTLDGAKYRRGVINVPVDPLPG